jgi:hypothetical protein
MLLDDEAGVFRRFDKRGPARLRGFREVALGLVERELAGCHRSNNQPRRCRFHIGRAAPTGSDPHNRCRKILPLHGSHFERCFPFAALALVLTKAGPDLRLKKHLDHEDGEVVFRPASFGSKATRSTAPTAALILKRAPLARTMTRPGDIRRAAHGYEPTRRRLAFTGN